MNGLLFFWANGGFEPQKLLRSSQARRHFFDIDVGKYLRQLPGGALWINELTRVRIERMGVDIRGQNPTVAVKDIRSTGQNLCRCGAGLGLNRLGHRQSRHPHTNDAKTDDEYPAHHK